LPDTQEAFDDLRKRIRSNKLYKDAIVSKDETSALILFYLSEDANVKDVAAAVIEKTEQLNLPEDLYFAGSPMLVSYISDLMKKDLVRLLPLAFLVIALVLFLSFRSWMGVVLPLGTAIIAIVWTLGSIAWLGYNMSMISNNIPIILLAVGSAYTIHVINKILLETDQQKSKRISKGLASVTTAVVLAGITTAIGFISFIFGAYLEMIVEFGIFTALGTLYSCILALTFAPAIMSIGTRHSRKSSSYTKFRIADTIASQLVQMTLKRPKRIIGVWLVLIAVGIAGIFKIDRSVNIQEYFKEGNPARTAEQIMMDKFGGTKPVFMRFKGDILNPQLLQKMKEASEYMEQSPDINSTLSVADLIAELNFAITGERSIPEDPEQIQQLWFLLDGNETLERLVSPDLNQAIIISKFKSPDNQSKLEFSDYMNDFISQQRSETIDIEITGMPFVDVVMDKSLINSQIGSILIALLFVVIVIGLVLKSFKYGILSTMPIVAAISLLFGIMGLTGISLNIGTVLVASVALGIGIDYSIHIIAQFNKQLKIHSNLNQAIYESVATSGKAIIINCLSVSLGFLVLIFSEMVPLLYFGVLIAVSMISSGLGALTLLPAVLLIINKENNE
jgi:predicted RND superfamily exporter protein